MKIPQELQGCGAVTAIVLCSGLGGFIESFRWDLVAEAKDLLKFGIIPHSVKLCGFRKSLAHW